MKERGMIFNTEMVRAILEGRKTQTRRPGGLRKINQRPDDWMVNLDDCNVRGVVSFHDTKSINVEWVKSSFGVPGDVIYVRETWNHSFLADDDVIRNGEYVYYADGYHVCQKWRPSIHMPRKAARIFLEITDVRVERVCDISEEDAVAEGVRQRNDDPVYPLDYKLCPSCGGELVHPSLGDRMGVTEVDCTTCDTYKKRYKILYEAIYGPDLWDNDWIWVYKFKVL